MRKLCLVIATLLCIPFIPPCTLQAMDAPSYIERFKDIAIREMHRSGIPASITLAQAIHESGWGNGRLAVNSNNYFGIKCKDYWVGPKYYIEDDDYDKDGKLMKSCFRAYEKIEDSFKDHSDFLRDNPRYNKLFVLNPRDYQAWAKGLQECGYATDKAYAKKIIAKIEQYQLHQYDTTPDPQPEQIVVAPASAPVFNISGFTTPPTTTPNQSITAIPEIAEETYDIPSAFTLPDDYQRGDNRDEASDNEPLYLGSSTTNTIPSVDLHPQAEIPQISAPARPPVREEQISYTAPEEAPPVPQQESLPIPAPVYHPPAPSPKEAEAIIRMSYVSDSKSAQLSRRPRVSNSGRR